MAWVLLLASAAAVLLIGLAATALILGSVQRGELSVRPSFWIAFGAACALTVVSLGLRSLRWVFLLRRAEMRLPIRDAYIGYFAGLSLLFAPFLLGEMAVRALVQRARGHVPVSITVVLNLWERLADLAALSLIAGIFSFVSVPMDLYSICLFVAAASTALASVRRGCLRGVLAAGRYVASRFDAEPPPDFRRLAQGKVWLTTLSASIVAWLLPGLAFWGLASTWGHPFGLERAEYAYAASSSLAGLVLAPGGILVAGRGLMMNLETAGFPGEAASLTVVGIRLATVGIATALGGVFLLIHLRAGRTGGASHFDAIADAYDVQIPEARRQALLARKTELMREVLASHGAGPRGLDVGCGQGSYIARMRSLGFDVSGIDASVGQVHRAVRTVGAADLVTTGSVLDIPANDSSYDFAYVINVLHHLSSVAEQRRAFVELVRILRPGGVLLVHEINTRNILFRFYMGYVFPSLNCIDEGVERWLLPHQMAVYTDVPVVDIRYFTFLPEFVPQGLARLLTPLERLLEASRLGVFSAHYMAVLQKKGKTGSDPFSHDAHEKGSDPLV